MCVSVYEYEYEYDYDYDYESMSYEQAAKREAIRSGSLSDRRSVLGASYCMSYMYEFEFEFEYEYEV